MQTSERTVGAAAGRRRAWIEALVAQLGDALLRGRRLILAIQWGMVAIYATLLIVPAFLPHSTRTDHLWSSIALFARFAFWGIWWPFVLISTMLIGRAWCGLFCPEGFLGQQASRVGRGGAIPRWLQWPGWPFTAFCITTVYGQLISVYQYPGPALLVLGGSTVAAMAAGYLWGRDKRVWCRFLCPVNGVFRILAKLAPLHFRVDGPAWEASRRAGQKPGLVRCAPMVAIRTMKGGSQCHMCGQCSGFRGAVCLALRSPNAEIVEVAGDHPDPWETALIIVGLMGVAVGAFLWSASPWLVTAKLSIARLLASIGVLWPLTADAPWWILTNYPDRHDVLSVLDGALVVGFIAASAAIAGTLVWVALAFATWCTGEWSMARLHHFAQALIPVAGAGIFLGLSATTVTMLSQEGLDMRWVSALRIGILAGASLWSLWLGWRISGRYARGRFRRIAGASALVPAVSVSIASWSLLLWA